MAASNPTSGGVGNPSTRPEVRKLLELALPTDTDLDVFAGDYCNEVYRSFTKGMLRPDKVSLLLDKVPLDRLVELLDQAHPAARLLPRQVQSAPSSSGSAGPALPAKPARFIGRDELDAKLTAALLEEAPKPVVILGGAGIGKSTLTLSVLHRPEIAARYGDRRYFVRLDAAKTADAVVSAIAVAMKLSAGGDPRASVLAALRRESAVLALDNGETPWEGDRNGSEALLGELASVPGLALVVSARGNARPGGLAWGMTLRVQRLDDAQAIEVFCSLVEEARRDDPAVASLVKELAGVPLAVTLLAHAAEGCPVSVLAKDWKAQRTALLTRLGEDLDRLSSWAVSIELSMGSRRMTSASRRMASLLGVLPDGAAEEDLEALISKEGPEAARVLAQVGLAYFNTGRLLMLAPIREHIAQVHPTVGEDLERAMNWYGQLATELGSKPGRRGGKEALARLTPETANLDAMIRRGLDGDDSVQWIDVALALTHYTRFSMRPYPCPIGRACQVARVEHETLREAKCIQGLGHVAAARSEHKEARVRYEEATGLFRRGGNKLGEANCVLSLAEIAVSRAEYEEARGGYEKALPLFRQERNKQGEANCILGLGRIAQKRSEYTEARSRYEEALPLYRQARSFLGEANCIRSLGDLARERSEYDHARSLYEKALPLYQQAGVVLGEANCVRSLGDLARDGSQPGQARTYYEGALELYAQIPDPYPMGTTHLLLARLAQDAPEKARHVAAARRCLTSIDRPDLVAELDAEFPPTP